MTITNMVGQTVGAEAIEPWFAMPQSLRFREAVWDPPFLFGRYTAHFAINRGYTQSSSTDEMDVVFWVIPWKILLAAIVGLLLIIFAEGGSLGT